MIHNGVDRKRFENVTPEKIPGSPVLCMVGNFTDKKDQISLISCMPELLQQFQNLKLVLVGRGKNIIKCKGICIQIRVLKSSSSLYENCDSPEVLYCRF